MADDYDNGLYTCDKCGFLFDPDDQRAWIGSPDPVDGVYSALCPACTMERDMAIEPTPANQCLLVALASGPECLYLERAKCLGPDCAHWRPLSGKCAFNVIADSFEALAISHT